jgi:hypothetical protein
MPPSVAEAVDAAEAEAANANANANGAGDGGAHAPLACATVTLVYPNKSDRPRLCGNFCFDELSFIRHSADYEFASRPIVALSPRSPGSPSMSSSSISLQPLVFLPAGWPCACHPGVAGVRLEQAIVGVGAAVVDAASGALLDAENRAIADEYQRFVGSAKEATKAGSKNASGPTSFDRDASFGLLGQPLRDGLRLPLRFS